MVLPLLYTTINMLLMLPALHLATTSLILAKLVKALLAAVVTQVPRNALGSQTGVGGVQQLPGGV